jgi:hypothetical protein
MNVNAVHLAYSYAHDKLHEASDFNRQVLSVTQLCNALEEGTNVARQMARVLTAAPDDVIKAAVMSVPEAAVTEGISTVDQLQSKWPLIRRTIRINSALSKESKQGFLSTCLAVISSALKVCTYCWLCKCLR